MIEGQVCVCDWQKDQHQAEKLVMAGGGPLDEIVLLDREVDPYTPMCTQLTYEGLVDETIQIKNGSVTMDNPSGRSQKRNACRGWCGLDTHLYHVHFLSLKPSVIHSKFQDKRDECNSMAEMHTVQAADRG